jgi:low temperature requirement protein LtrA
VVVVLRLGVHVAQLRLAEAACPHRAALARDVYSYLQLPMLGGIVLFAFGLESALHDTTTALAIVPAFGLVCGISLYLIAHVALRLRIGGGLGRGRPVASLLLLELLPIATHAGRCCARHSRLHMRCGAHHIRGHTAP